MRCVTESPALSVITPTFNAARYIEACLDNVRAQDRDDVEHIVVDGGSTDGTREAVLARQAIDWRVRLIDGPDHGQSHAMNKGVVAARGGIIGMLNVDDAYLPGALARAIAELTHAPSPSLLWGALEIQNLGPNPHAFLEAFPSRIDEHGQTFWIQYPGRFEAWRLLLGWHVEPHPANPACYFYHRALHFAAGLYEEDNHYFMDHTFLLKAACHTKRVITTRDVLGRFVLHPESKTYSASAGTVTTHFRSPVPDLVLHSLPMPQRLRVEFHRLRRRVAERSRLASWVWNTGKRLVGRARSGTQQ